MRLVFLHGPPAAGKLTVAREIAALTGFPVFHNHLVVDAVAAVFPFGAEPFVRLRERFWLEVLGEAAAAGQSLIFTFAPEPTVTPGFPERALAAVATAGGHVDFVRLTLPDAEQERRLVDPGRAAFGKLRSLDLLRRIRADMAACEAAMPASALTIDTGAVSQGEAARLVVSTLGLPTAPPVA
ncbi:AAA family ATPase [Plastoroseomonas hellenica]|uniref:AAA family ATPase n=1 Tax=Plastoroseomonas hellenica TaxID=2687306 RepID=UPI001BAB3C5F|nr:shikimate kinase [Plastoroseomonas hellenica]MBR0647389.1 shikimate kinase [Plastoroseomonas hellenica]